LVVERTFPLRPHTASSAPDTAATASVIGASGRYSISTAAAARRAVATSPAMTIASTSPA
jgi:hypothetical protein